MHEMHVMTSKGRMILVGGVTPNSRELGFLSSESQTPANSAFYRPNPKLQRTRLSIVRIPNSSELGFLSSESQIPLNSAFYCPNPKFHRTRLSIVRFLNSIALGVLLSVSLTPFHL